jgi:hypothetical protein
MASGFDCLKVRFGRGRPLLSLPLLLPSYFGLSSPVFFLLLSSTLFLLFFFFSGLLSLLSLFAISLTAHFFLLSVSLLLDFSSSSLLSLVASLLLTLALPPISLSLYLSRSLSTCVFFSDLLWSFSSISVVLIRSALFAGLSSLFSVLSSRLFCSLFSLLSSVFCSFFCLLSCLLF